MEEGTVSLDVDHFVESWTENGVEFVANVVANKDHLVGNNFGVLSVVGCIGNFSLLGASLAILCDGRLDGVVVNSSTRKVLLLARPKHHGTWRYPG